MRVKYIINTNDDLALTMGKSYDVLANSKDFIVVYNDNGNICKYDRDCFEIVPPDEVKPDEVCYDDYEELLEMCEITYPSDNEAPDNKPPLPAVMPRKEFELERISQLVRVLNTSLENNCDDYELLSEWAEEIYDRIFNLMYEE